MMPDLSDIYNAEFFGEWGKHHERYVRGAAIITALLAEQFQPRRIADVGCGCGVYSYFFAQNGVDSVRLDGVLPPETSRFDGAWVIRDLTEPFQNKWGEFDLTICLEVAEHIPPRFTDVFLKNLVQFGGVLILSAAPPHQGGHHHVNEQPKRYWVEKLSKMGFAYRRQETGHFVEAFKKTDTPYKWMGEHISVYRRVEHPDNFKEDLPFAVRMKG